MAQNSKASLDNDIISRPAHYIKGRMIEPITVIEEFGLCHHLACVVKYIARAGRKTSTINDLLKSYWYLERELARQQAGTEPCSPTLNENPSFKAEAICADWNLSLQLSGVLSCVLKYRQMSTAHRTIAYTLYPRLMHPYEDNLLWLKKNSTSSNPKQMWDEAFPLSKAREHLRLAISEHEQGEWQ